MPVHDKVMDTTLIDAFITKGKLKQIVLNNKPGAMAGFVV
jgi:hypothetical protein